MKKTQIVALVGLLLVSSPLVVTGQEHDHSHEAQPAAGFEGMVWTDPDFATIADMLIGSWGTTAPVAQFGESGVLTNVVMSIGPAKLSTLPDALYIETARADSVDRPYRSAFLQFYRRQGRIRLRTLEIRDPNHPINNLLIGMWALPEFMPDISRDQMIATLDLEFTGVDGGWIGETPYPYPTATGGAVEMTSRLKVTPGGIETADRGFDAEGNVVWGADKNDRYSFTRRPSPFTIDRHELGLVSITLRDDPSGIAPSDGDTVAFQYTGWLTDGTMFDTSRRQGKAPLEYALPGNLIEGWMIATRGMTQGDWRKFVVPPDLGYGASSAGGGRIPANSTLIFEAELVGVRPAIEPDGAPQGPGQ